MKDRQNNVKAIATRSDMVFRENGQCVEEVLSKMESKSDLRDLFVAAGVKWNERTRFYELNGLTDITESEMIDIYAAYNGEVGTSFTAKFWKSSIRTNIPLRQYTEPPRLTDCFRYCENLIVANIDYIGILLDVANTFYECFRLEQVKGLFRVYERKLNSTFYRCYALRSLQLRELSENVDFQWSSLLSNESILYMVQNSRAKKDISITLHPEAFSRAVADQDIQQALQEKTFVSLVQAEVLK